MIRSRGSNCWIWSNTRHLGARSGLRPIYPVHLRGFGRKIRCTDHTARCTFPTESCFCRFEGAFLACMGLLRSCVRIVTRCPLPRCESSPEQLHVSACSLYSRACFWRVSVHFFLFGPACSAVCHLEPGGCDFFA